MQKFGVDLSSHNAGINFLNLKNEGVEFAILRAGYTGYGNGVSKAKDTSFEEFYNVAKEVGMGVGAYWFSCANTYDKGKAEAEFMYENCLKGKQFDYPIYIDVENDTGGKNWLVNAGKEAITDGIIGFCETLENLGYYVGIYANQDWFKNWINLDRVKDYDKWLAAWLKSKPRTFLSDTMWQFGGETNQQRSPILAGQTVDQNYCYIDYPSIIKNGGFNGYPKTEKVDEPKEESKDEEPKKTNEEIAFEVLDGKWGTKETTPTRKEMLEAAGYDYQAIQDIVNEKLGIKKSSTPTTQYYIIRWGDTLTSIAKKYDTTVEKLCELNGISDPNLIFAGNQLKVR